MKARTEYLVQVIEKIGGPLLDAVTANSAKDDGVTISKEQAEQVATLLAKTVQLSISLGKLIEIEKTEADVTDSLRVAMAGLASPIIASQYRHSGKAPSDDDMGKLGNALEAVMTFSDNFSPSPENAERLKTLMSNGSPVDIHQVNVQYIHAFVPVADVITRFPFGQAEKKMVQDAAEKITAKAKAIREDIFGDIEDKDTQRLYELGIVKALADLYTHCHTQEMDKLMALQEPDADAQTKALSALWDNFKMRAETLQTLAENIMPKGVKAATASGSGGSGPAVAAAATAPTAATTAAPPPAVAPQQPPATETAPPPPPVAPPVTPPAEQQTQQPPAQSAAPPIFQKPQGESAPPAAAPPPAQTEQTPPAAPPPPPQQPASQPPQDTQQQGGNPMSMFAKPKDNAAETAPPPPPAAPPVAPPAEQAPPAAPPPPPVEQQPAQPPQQPPAAPPPAEQQGEGEQGGNSGGGPMSFFKTPPKDEG